MARINVSVEDVRKLIDDLEEVIYCKREEPWRETLIYFPQEVYSDEEARQVARDLLYAVSWFASDFRIEDDPDGSLNLLVDMLKGTASVLANLFDEENKENKNEGTP